VRETIFPLDEEGGLVEKGGGRLLKVGRVGPALVITFPLPQLPRREKGARIGSKRSAEEKKERSQR